MRVSFVIMITRSSPMVGGYNFKGGCMKKLLLALLVLGVTGANAMGSWNNNSLLGTRTATQAPVRNPSADAGWTNDTMLGTRSSTMTPAGDINQVNPQAVDTGWNNQGLLGTTNMNTGTQSVAPSVDAGWSLQDLQ